ncbi:MAG: methane monooxygenase/ammonia monooxygenase subunit B [Nitrosopumilaceae archaeon]
MDSYGITMVNKKLIVAALGVIVALGTVGPSLSQMLQQAEAHGVQAQLQSRFVRIEDETWSRQSINTGETITVKGTLVSLVQRDLRAWLSVFSESANAGNRWEFVSRDPPGNVFDIPGNGVVDYTMTVKALEPAVYHLHTQLNIASIGPGLGPGQTVVVEGEMITKPIPYSNIAYQSIIIAVGYVVTFATRPWQVI